MMNRRIFIGGGLLGGAALFVGKGRHVFAAGERKVLVFVPSDEKPRSIEAKLVATMGSLDITVFGRARDLELALSREKADAVIAPAPTLQNLGLSITLNGVRGGSSTEPYVLVTADRPIPPEQLSNEPIGMFGIMGRTGMKRHCGKLLGTGEQKMIKTVTKYADLLPLLQFKATKGVILPKREVSVLTSRSALKLVVNDLPSGQVGLVCASIRDGEAKTRLIAQVKGLSGAANGSLGVEGWK